MNPSKTISPKSSQLGRSLSKLGYAANSKQTAPTKVAWNNRERFDSVLVRTRMIKWRTAANPAFKRASTTPTESSPPAGLRSIKTPKNQKMASNQLIRLTCSRNSGIASNMTKIWNRYIIEMVSPTVFSLRAWPIVRQQMARITPRPITQRVRTVLQKEFPTRGQAKAKRSNRPAK